MQQGFITLERVQTYDISEQKRLRIDKFDRANEKDVVITKQQYNKNKQIYWHCCQAIKNKQIKTLQSKISLKQSQNPNPFSS